MIADSQYDELFAYLRAAEEIFLHLVRSDSPTQRLTYQLQDNFAQAEHVVPLLSLENSYNAEDLKDWDESLQKIVAKAKAANEDSEITAITYTAEPKYDGISIELIYQNGQFTQAITRGDGYIGEDITENVKTILSVPYYLQDKSHSLRLRGEIVMTKKAFERVNKERAEAGEALFANPRNATSGSLRQLDTGVTAKRGLICYVYQILE
ncbi:hypothetical protein KBC03_05955 [Patescibacteria group bacterium]|nr:hypothetical protein [Patescibacteria group bacterium]